MKNKTARELLEEIYGKGCMFQRARIAERIEELNRSVDERFRRKKVTK